MSKEYPHCQWPSVPASLLGNGIASGRAMGSMIWTGNNAYWTALLLIIPGVSHRACWWDWKHGIRTACNVVPGKCEPVTAKSWHISRRDMSFFCFIYDPEEIVAAKRCTMVDLPTLAHPTTNTSLPPNDASNFSANSKMPAFVTELTAKTLKITDPSPIILPIRLDSFWQIYGSILGNKSILLMTNQTGVFFPMIRRKCFTAECSGSVASTTTRHMPYRRRPTMCCNWLAKTCGLTSAKAS